MGKDFEAKFISQSPYENRSIQKTLDLGWELLSELPREDLDRVDDKTIEKYYKGK